MSTSGEHEKRLADMNHGRILSVAWTTLQPLLTSLRTAALAELTTGYREGKSPDELHFRIAKLVSVEDLETALKSRIVRGERAASELSGELNGRQ